MLTRKQIAALRAAQPAPTMTTEQKVAALLVEEAGLSAGYYKPARLPAETDAEALTRRRGEVARGLAKLRQRL